MKHIQASFMVIVIVLVMLIGAVPVQAGGNISPTQMLTEYYNLINSRQYAVAYAQWENPAQSYNEFVTGYGDTQWVTAYFGFSHPGAVYGLTGRVPALLYGFRYGGSVAAYSGWYELRYNPGTSGLAQWTIVDASFQLLPSVPPHTPEAIDAYLSLDPYDPDDIYESVTDVLNEYYDSIVREDFQTAYNMWITPRQTYQDFVDGFAETEDIVMFFGELHAAPTGATEIGAIPVVLVGYHTDGSVASFTGCFHLGYDVGEPGILGANLTELTMPTTYPALLSALQTPCYTTG